MKYRHYAPNAKMALVTTKLLKDKDYVVTEEERRIADEKVAACIRTMVEEDIAKGLRVGVICCAETVARYQAKVHGSDVDIRVIGSRQKPLSMTHELFRILREFDMDGVDQIYAESYSDRGVGFALMNRMRKAAGMTELLAD
jgi:L-threonylcarbamoyladenylate synthase